jgi:hypothetical protein
LSTEQLLNKARRWPIEQYFQRGKDDLGLDARKKTSGLTWEQALPAMQPLIVRSRGLCRCYLTQFEDFSPIFT